MSWPGPGPGRPRTRTREQKAHTGVQKVIYEYLRRVGDARPTTREVAAALCGIKVEDSKVDALAKQLGGDRQRAYSMAVELLVTDDQASKAERTLRVMQADDIIVEADGRWELADFAEARAEAEASEEQRQREQQDRNEALGWLDHNWDIFHETDDPEVALDFIIERRELLRSYAASGFRMGYYDTVAVLRWLKAKGYPDAVFLGDLLDSDLPDDAYGVSEQRALILKASELVDARRAAEKSAKDEANRCIVSEMEERHRQESQLAREREEAQQIQLERHHRRMESKRILERAQEWLAQLTYDLIPQVKAELERAQAKAKALEADLQERVAAKAKTFKVTRDLRAAQEVVQRLLAELAEKEGPETERAKLAVQERVAWVQGWAAKDAALAAGAQEPEATDRGRAAYVDACKALGVGPWDHEFIG